MILAGMGPGLSMGIARRFGQAGYRIGMISRNAEKLAAYQAELSGEGIHTAYAAADLSDTGQLLEALAALQAQLGRVDLLIYNAVDARYVHVLEDRADDLVKGFRLGVANALAAVQALLPELQRTGGAVILTGGGTALRPYPAMASISLSKAGIRNLAYQLHEALAPQGVFAGTVTVMGQIQAESATHSPERLAEQFWLLNERRDAAELKY